MESLGYEAVAQTPAWRLLHKASGGAFHGCGAERAAGRSVSGGAAGCWPAAVLGGCLAGAPEFEQVVGGGDQLPLGLAGA